MGNNKPVNIRPSTTDAERIPILDIVVTNSCPSFLFSLFSSKSNLFLSTRGIPKYLCNKTVTFGLIIDPQFQKITIVPK